MYVVRSWGGERARATHVTFLITRVISFSPELLKRIVIFLAGGFLGLLTSFRTMTSLAKTSIVALFAAFS